MSGFYVGEIQIFGFNFPPKGWALCNGQILPIQQNAALFSLLGTTYGGNGTTTFALPDLQGRLPMGQGSGPGLTPRTIGEKFGEEQHTLLPGENPVHNHTVAAISNPTLTNNFDVPGPTGLLAQTKYNGATPNVQGLMYVVDAAPANAMDPTAVGKVGGQPHSNIMPLLAVNFCIALSGIFPSRN